MGFFAIKEIMKTKILLFVIGLSFFSVGKADDHGDAQPTDMKMNETDSGTFLSSELTIANEFPFSDAVLAGNTLYVSGMVGTNEVGELVKGGIEEEAHSIFQQLKSRLGALNLNLSNVVKCLVMLDDIDEWGGFNKVYMSYFKPPYPARSALGADGLALGAAVEMECIAVLP